MTVKSEAKRLGDLLRAEKAIARELEIANYAVLPKKCGNLRCSNNLSFNQRNLRFCSVSCSNAAIVRINSDAAEKMRKTVRNKTLLYCKVRRCKTCGKFFQEPTRALKNLGITKTFCSKQCNFIADSAASKLAISNSKRNGTFKGWASSPRNIDSYPEKYFTKVFNSTDLTEYVREKKVGRWFIDFAFESKMIAVEIDGRQHDEPDRKANDEKKDAYLKSLGWTVLRVRWHNPVNQINRDLLYPQINAVLDTLRA